MAPSICVIIPVYNAEAHLPRCLAALNNSCAVEWECLVVDDGSTDNSVAIAKRLGARVISMDRDTRGPGQARNLGARWATAPLLLFLDADVVVRGDTLAKFVALFQEDVQLAAAFGSYDASPGCEDLLSQYRNLLHHFVHQTGNEVATTFWSGCGAIRRDIFLRMGGFDCAYVRPSIEDIELGYRLSQSKLRIRLVKSIQVTHLKRWTFWNILRTDIRDRALPWTELIRRTGTMPNDLNLQTSGRLSAMSVYAFLGFILVGIWMPLAWFGCPVAIATLLICNRELYLFFVNQRGTWFFIRVLPLHVLYFTYSAAAFAYGLIVMPALRRPRVSLGRRTRDA